MQTLRVNLPGHEYDIRIGEGLLDETGKMVGEIFGGRKIAVVTDENVYALYAGRLGSSLESAGYDYAFITIPPGEASKSFACLERVCDGLLDRNITKSDLVIALGGGVVGDLAGFAAAVWLRGVPVVQIPTTLLAQVDSGVGGKTAVNLPRGKNLIGAFHQPWMVIADTGCLGTLSGRGFADGMAEVIKYGAALDAGLFDILERDSAESVKRNIAGIVYVCCDLKRSVVERDEHDEGPRMVLNFGHTFGHAIEKRWNYERYTHGEAVALGMVIAARLGERAGITAPGTSDRIRDVAEKFGLPSEAGIDARHLLETVRADKKTRGESIHFVFIKKPGEYHIKKMKIDELGDLI